MNYKRLIISLVVPQLAGTIGSMFSRPSISVWYNSLNKPIFNPPNWIFAPVWILLYFLMGVSVYLVWQNISINAYTREALWLFWLNLIFNISWSMVFFSFHAIGTALINIVIIWLFILALMMTFYRINKLSAYLLIPYFAWVSFAMVLNYYIWILN